jgi:Protein of unknown function (DUF541)
MRAILFLFSASLLFAQLDSNSVTVTASRSMSIQPDQVVFGVSVIAPLTASLDDVVAAVQGSGITASQLSSVNTGQPIAITGNPFFTQLNLQWTFSVPEPLAKLTSTAASLTALQKTLAQKSIGFSLSFGIEGTRASQQLLASQPCSKTDLIADATTQGQKMTNAAGLTLGPILSLSSINTTGVIGSSYAPAISFRSGDFVSVTGFSSFLIGAISPFLPPPQPVICSLTVKFSLVRY